MEKLYLRFLRFCFRKEADDLATLFEIQFSCLATAVLSAVVLFPKGGAILLFIIALLGGVLYALVQYLSKKILKLRGHSVFYRVARYCLLSTLAKKYFQDRVSVKDLNTVTSCVSNPVGLKIQVGVAEIFHNHYEKKWFILTALNHLFEDESHNFLFEGDEQYFLLNYYVKSGLLGDNFSYDVYRGFEHFMDMVGNVLYRKIMAARKEAVIRMKVKPGEAVEPDEEYKNFVSSLIDIPNIDHRDRNKILEAVLGAALSSGNYRIHRKGLHTPIYGGVR